MAVPSLTIVAPSCTAISKSWLIPIDNSRSRAGSVPVFSSVARRSLSCAKYGRAFSGFSKNGGIVMSPTRRAERQRSAALTMSIAASAGTPCLVASPARSTCTSRSGVVPVCAAAASMASSSPTLSTEWIALNRDAAFRTLFDCSVPIRCHLILRSADPSIFCRASCTRFSPKSCWPAAAAALTWSRLNVLLTARRRTSPGLRPASLAAIWMRNRARARLRAMSV